MGVYIPSPVHNAAAGLCYILIAVGILVLLFFIGRMHSMGNTRTVIYLTLIIDFMFCISMFISGVQSFSMAADELRVEDDEDTGTPT